MIPYLLAVGLAQAPASSPSAAPEKCIVEGRVIDQTSGEGLRKVTVWLQPASLFPRASTQPSIVDYASTSDSEGKFLFWEVEPGAYRLRAERVGYVPPDQPRRRAELDLVLVPGEHKTDLLLKLARQGVLAGHVLDEDGDPVTTAAVTVERFRGVRGRQRFVESQGANVDQDGYFLVSGLQPGRYYLYATPEDPRGRSRRQGPEEGFVTTWYPSATGRAEAAPIELAAGRELRNLEIRLRKTAVFRVRGRVSSALPGKPDENLTLMLSPDDQGGSSSLLTHLSEVRGDVFEFTNVLPGSYVIQTSPRHLTQDAETGEYHRVARSYCYVPVTVSSQNLEDVLVELGAGARITGRVRVEGSPTTAPAQTGESKRTRHVVTLMPLDDTRRQINVTSKEDGALRASNVPPGRYRVSVSLSPGRYLKMVRYDGREVTNAPLVVPFGADGTLDILLSPHAAAVGGVVHGQDGGAVAGVTVLLWSSDGIVSQAFDTDEDGDFVFRNLAPGEYYVAAGEEIDPEMLNDPESLKALEDYANRVVLKEDSRETVELTLMSL